jgi:glycerate 2-kinase
MIVGKLDRPVLVAPDKFKGTLSAQEAALAIGRGLAGHGIEPIELLPVADGGEGTMDALVRALGGRVLATEVHDPLGRQVEAAFGLVHGGRAAIVEMSQASGLWRVAPGERDAVAASTRGTGELIRAAIESGAREVIVAVGGSATTDGGRGALEALGARFTRNRADLEELRRTLRRVRIAVACDVRNPLLGPEGAARVFSPQKGASPGEVEELERRLRDWARLARKTAGKDPAAEPLAGAAGGLAGGLWAFAGAELRLGAALVLDVAGFDARAREAFAVVTGEGRLDEQTLGGKAVFEVATRCRQGGVPCYAVVGADGLGAFEHRMMNIEVEAGAHGERLASAGDIERAAGRLARRLLSARPVNARSPHRSRPSSAPR